MSVEDAAVERGKDIPVLAATCTLDILKQLLPEIIFQLGAKVRGVQEDGVRQLELSSRVISIFDV